MQTMAGLISEPLCICYLKSLVEGWVRDDSALLVLQVHTLSFKPTQRLNYSRRISSI